MKRLTTVLFSTATLFALTNLASALTWEDRQGYAITGVPLDFLHEQYRNREGDLEYSGIFDITVYGFNPGIHTITDIAVGFSFSDDVGNDIDEYVDILVGGELVWNNLEVDGSHPSANFEWHWTSGNANIFLDLSTDGTLSYQVLILDLADDPVGQGPSHREDTYLNDAVLIVQGFERQPQSINVPDGGTTVAFLSLGLLGLAGLRRKFAN